jgi:4-carboxymuconolactone decarboxylase
LALGAALGSDCVSCIEFHVPASREAGLTDAHISEAIRLADRLRQVPGRKTLDAALSLLSKSAPAAESGKGCCG